MLDKLGPVIVSASQPVPKCKQMLIDGYNSHSTILFHEDAQVRVDCS